MLGLVAAHESSPLKRDVGSQLAPHWQLLKRIRVTADWCPGESYFSARLCDLADGRQTRSYQHDRTGTRSIVFTQAPECCLEQFASLLPTCNRARIGTDALLPGMTAVYSCCATLFAQLPNSRQQGCIFLSVAPHLGFFAPCSEILCYRHSKLLL